MLKMLNYFSVSPRKSQSLPCSVNPYTTCVLTPTLHALTSPLISLPLNDSVPATLGLPYCSLLEHCIRCLLQPALSFSSSGVLTTFPSGSAQSPWPGKALPDKAYEIRNSTSRLNFLPWCCYHLIYIYTHFFSLCLLSFLQIQAPGGQGLCLSHSLLCSHSQDM